MKKFVISIDESGVRLNNFFNINFLEKSEFLQVGIVGKNLSALDYYNFGVKESFPPLSPAELGCTLSHIKALEIFLNSEEKYALVLEDDVIFRSKVDFSDSNFDSLGRNFIFLLGGVDLKLCKNLKGKSIDFGDLNVLKVDYGSRRNLYYTMGYVLDKESAKYIIKYHLDFCKKADDWAGFYEFSKETNFYISNFLIHPDIDEINTSNSSISSERYPHFYYIKKAFYLFCRILNRRISYCIRYLLGSKFK